MHPNQASLVRGSWPAIASSVDTLTTSFYGCLFEIDSSAARLFAGVDMTLQRSKLAQTLAVIVHAIDDPESLVRTVAALGRRHATYGIEDRHFDAVGVALLRALSTTLGPAFDRDLQDAWSEAYSLIAAVMRRALVRASTVVAEPASERT